MSETTPYSGRSERRNPNWEEKEILQISKHANERKSLMDDTVNEPKINKPRKQTAAQKLTNFLRSPIAQEYPLCASRRLILHALASYCYYKDECNPSIESIMDYSQLGDSYVRKNLQALEALSLISIVRKNGVRNKYIWKVPYVQDEDVYRKKIVRKS